MGREVRYKVAYSVPTPDGTSREYVHVFLPPEAPGLPDTNVSHKLLKAGWARVHDSASRRNPSGQSEEDEQEGWKSVQRTVQDEAQNENLGVWGQDQQLKVDHTLDDAVSFLSEWRGQQIDSVVEQVRDGSMLRVRLLLSPNHHQIISLSLAGVKAPKLATAGGANTHEANEPYAEEARFFVESRILQRNVRVTLLALPQQSSAPTPFSLNGNGPSSAPTTTSSTVIGKVLHPVGDIAQFLLASGFAKCVDWHAGFLASAGGMTKYREAEKNAKDKRLNVWQSYAPAAKNEDAFVANTFSRTFEATVLRIISGDTILVRRNDNSGEQRLQLSSIRQPSTKDEKQAGYAHEARELLRKRLVGKVVSVNVDYIKKEQGTDDRLFATIRAITGNKELRGTEIGDMLLQRGLATVTRHRAGDEDRSPDWDRLIALEAEASEQKRGLHSGKELSAPKYVEASENVGRAHGYLTSLKRQGRVHAVVDFCASASRFKVIVPRENCRLTFVLAGIRAPRTARNPQEKSEPFSQEGLAWSASRVLQRDVDLEVFSTDKAGGFIGAMYLNKNENVAVQLVGEGFAQVHEYSAANLAFATQLTEAEKQARTTKKGLWINEPAQDDPAALEDTNGHSHGGLPTKAWSGGSTSQESTPRSEYIDIVVSDVRGDGGASIPFGFSVQILNDQIQNLETLMKDLSVQPPSGTLQPKVGDWVCAKFSGDGQWYRGQVLRNKPAQKTREIKFVDYGNVEDVPFADTRPLDELRFGKRKLPAQALEARLSFIKLYEGKTTPVAGSAGQPDEYAYDALERFKQITEGRKLIGKVETRYVP